MNENKVSVLEKSLEELKQEKQKLQNVVISRRSFLSKTGVVIAAGALSHFVFVGRASAREFGKVLSNRVELECAVGTCDSSLVDRS